MIPRHLPIPDKLDLGLAWNRLQIRMEDRCFLLPCFVVSMAMSRVTEAEEFADVGHVVLLLRSQFQALEEEYGVLGWRQLGALPLDRR